MIFISRNREKGETDSREDCHEENTRGRGARNNKNANGLRPGRHDKGFKIENRNKREIKFLWGKE